MVSSGSITYRLSITDCQHLHETIVIWTGSMQAITIWTGQGMMDIRQGHIVADTRTDHNDKVLCCCTYVGLASLWQCKTFHRTRVMIVIHMLTLLPTDRINSFLTYLIFPPISVVFFYSVAELIL